MEELEEFEESERTVALDEPEVSEDTPLWELCEIGPWRGYVSGEFIAVVGGKPFAKSRTFRWRGREQAPPDTAETRGRLRELLDALEADGWVPETRARDEPWYRPRFRRALDPDLARELPLEAADLEDEPSYEAASPPEAVAPETVAPKPSRPPALRPIAPAPPEEKQPPPDPRYVSFPRWRVARVGASPTSPSDAVDSAKLKPPPPWYIGVKLSQPRHERPASEEEDDLLSRLSIYEGARLPPGWEGRRRWASDVDAREGSDSVAREVGGAAGSVDLPDERDYDDG